MAKTLQIPLDVKIKELQDIPYTITYVIRKRIQIDNLNELPKEKRPPEYMIWYGLSEDLDEWIDSVLDLKKNRQDLVEMDITEIEG